MKIGYPCENIFLRSLSDGKVRGNRSARKSSIEKKGVNYVAPKCEKNINYVKEILKWNNYNNINFYRFPSIIPWYSKHNIEGLDNSKWIYQNLKDIGNFITENNIRISFHPAHFVKLASDNKSTVKNSVQELEYYATLLDLMGLERSCKYPINIHIGATYEGMEETADRFEKQYNKLEEKVRKRLVVENDDKESCWGVYDLLDLNDRVGVPIVLDTLHHNFTNRGLSLQEAFNKSYSTWNEKVVVHHSNSKKMFEEGSAREHTNWIYSEVMINGSYDIMIEAKKKEQAVLKYKYDFNVN